MAVSVTMPRLGESVSEGTVTRWLKKEGERVEADEPLLEVSTDKVDTEIPSPAAGIVTSIKVQEDETVEVGVELAIIDDGAGGGDGGSEEPTPEPESTPEPEPTPEAEPAPEPEPTPEPEPAAQAAPEPAAAQESAPAAAAPAPQPVSQQEQSQPDAPSAPSGGQGSEGAEGAYVTPLVRKLAAEHGVDLSNIQGTGVGGRIRKQDVLDAADQGGGQQPAAPAPAAPAQQAPAEQAPAEQAPPGPAARPPAETQKASAPAPASQPAKAAASTAVRGKTEDLTRLRKVIASRMTESLQVSAQLTTVLEADVTKIARLRDQAKAGFEAREGVKLSFLPFFALATVEALKTHPVVNSSIDLDAGTVTYHDGVHLGIAVDTERGLLVPVLHDAGDLNLAGMARKIADLAERTRSNKVTPDELGGGTFTLTNTGSRGALFDTPIINQPQVGILGTGAVVKRAVVVEDPQLGEVVTVRSMVYLALTYDHRIVDGADAARFLTTVKERLEEGDFAGELGL